MRDLSYHLYAMQDDNRIRLVSSKWEFTVEQVAIVGRIFTPELFNKRNPQCTHRDVAKHLNLRGWGGGACGRNVPNNFYLKCSSCRGRPFNALIVISIIFLLSRGKYVRSGGIPPENFRIFWNSMTAFLAFSEASKRTVICLATYRKLLWKFKFCKRTFIFLELFKLI